MGEQCDLTGNDEAIYVQFLLGIIFMLTLFLKWWAFENPRRDIKVWGYDVTKQAVSAGVQHFCNVSIAVAVYYEVRQCAKCDCPPHPHLPQPHRPSLHPNKMILLTRLLLEYCSF